MAADKARRDAANQDSYAGKVRHSYIISGGDSNKMKKLHERLITAAVNLRRLDSYNTWQKGYTD
ncbi:MAG: hypothetical protein WA667_25465 [Candidatus Nitrosopolaris sp.]